LQEGEEGAREREHEAEKVRRQQVHIEPTQCCAQWEQDVALRTLLRHRLRAAVRRQTNSQKPLKPSRFS